MSYAQSHKSSTDDPQSMNQQSPSGCQHHHLHQQQNHNKSKNDEKDSEICSLSCLVTNCLCTTSFSSPQPQSALLLPFLRSSLFPNVPPTIRFYLKGCKVSKPKKSVRNSLTWCRNSLLPLVMRQCLSTSHFTLVDETINWVGYWGHHLKSVQYRGIKPYQKVNHFPGAFHMGRKDRLWQHINEMISVWSSDEYQIMPITYVLPRDIKKLRTYLLESSRRSIILKPPASARGTGISIVNDIREIPKKTPLVAQHYIDRPLIVNGAKFDLRLYVYITSLDPLRIYLYDDGIVRFASVPYSCATSSLSNKFMHLTNYSINKLAQSAGESSAPVPKWRLSDFWSKIESYVDVNLVKKRINDIVVKAVLACESHIRSHQKKYSMYTFTSHELYGMDILLDESCKPWLLEMNITPSLQCATPSDTSVKTRLAKDVLNLSGIHFPPNENEKNTNLCIDYRLKPFDGNKSKFDLEKELYHVEYYKANGKIDVSITKRLTASDARILIDFEDELSRADGFNLLFPMAERYDYIKYYNGTPTYANLLLLQWQLEQCLCGREAGIAMLKEISNRGDHIAENCLNDVSEEPPK